MSEPAPETFSDRFISHAGEAIYSQCIACRHKHTTGGTCSAFPDGIPLEILTNRFDHTQPYPGDGGITFEPA